MNPFKELPKDGKITYANWNSLAVKPYDKNTTGPYTKTRVILMNGTEFESNWFLHQFNRHCLNNDIRRAIAEVRRQEQQQQKRISALKPLDETVLEHTIGYEQLAVDLTAEMAQKEPNPIVKAQLDFALLEDFDHLYRYANLLDMEEGVHAERLVGAYTEITPARPTISEHRHPNDDVRRYINCWQDSLITRLHTGIITAAEQQTMNYYMNISGFYHSDLGRKLFSEIAMIEEQHVTGYGSLMDPSSTWLECWVMHEYTECYLYYSCYADESNPYIKNIWLTHFEEELKHLKIASEMLYKYEGREWEQLFVSGSEFPSLIKLKSNKDYIREVIKSVRLTGLKETTVNINDLPDGADFFKYQRQVNSSVGQVASHNVIEKYIKRNGEDYRYEDKESVEKTLRDRKSDNTELGRKKNA
jgi:rubrerythrin